MQWLSVLTAAIAPGIALLAYFYLKDRYHSEPINWVAKIFLFGLLLVFPTMVLQRAIVLGIGENPFVFSFLISAGMEEFFKWFIVYFLVFKHTVFDEPYDGIVYAVAAALGFATLENVIYALLHQFSFAQLLYRALIPVSGHALFGVMMGFYLGKAKFSAFRQRRFLTYSLLFPVLSHGILNIVLLHEDSRYIWLVVPLMVALWGNALWKVRRANNQSPFRRTVGG